MDDHEYNWIVPKLWESDKALVIGVDKIGGGTLGSEYEGAWEFAVYDDGEIMFTAVFTTGMPKDHGQAAAIAAQHWAELLDEDQWTLYDRLNYMASRVLMED